MTPISNIEQIEKLKTDERLVRCCLGNIDYYRFLYFHPRNRNYVILLDHCEHPVRFHIDELTSYFFTDYSTRDVLNYQREYLKNKLNQVERRLSELDNKELLEK